MKVTVKEYIYEYTFSMTGEERTILISLIRQSQTYAGSNHERVRSEFLAGLDVKP